MERIGIDFLKRQYKNVYAHIVVIGTGATGSVVIQQLAQLLSVFDIPRKIILADCDVFEEKNLKNQLCVPKDMGKYKADVLARRYGAAYQMKISTYTSNYVEDIETINGLFYNNYEYGKARGCFYLPILISCVDNNFSRKVFHQYFESAENLLYLDVGNESVILPSNYLTRPKQEWTNEELETYNDSGFTGQLVCGLKLKGQVIAEPIASVFPDILEDDDEIAPSELSCTELAASEPQRIITNRYSALAVNTILSEVFELGTLSTHKIFYHAKKGYMRSEPIMK